MTTLDQLPVPAPEAAEHSHRLSALLRQRIAEASGWLSFADFMALTLYAPGLGYYAAGARKFGSAGDFVTAPEMSGLFGAALASQIAEILPLSAPYVLEVGAGSGRLAADLLASLAEAGALPERYYILDQSADLRERQQATLAAAVPQWLDRVEWLDQLPEQFSGVVVGNELLDAMPAHIVVWREEGVFERGVAVDASGQFLWQEQPAQSVLLDAAEEIGRQCSLPPGYESEISLAARAWAGEWGHRLVRGALLLIDYGFPRREFYHQQRARGTLMCHYRHRAHPDPFFWPGLQDLTVHVDFTAVIAAADAAGLDLLGYTNQGQFLINCGILDALAMLPQGTPDYFRASGAVGKLLMPHEMGELFKVIAIGRELTSPLLGFRQGDQSRRL